MTLSFASRALIVLLPLTLTGVATSSAWAQPATTDGAARSPTHAVTPPAPPPPAEPPPPRQDEDGVRFRGGAGLEGGVLIVPDATSLPTVGAQGQIGVQLNDLLGIYAVPSLGAVFGEVGGLNVAAALLVDFTFGDIVSVGLGPDVGAFAAIGVSSTNASAAGGELYGGRLHFAVYPVLGEGENPIRRKALAIGVDLRLLSGAAGIVSTGTSGTTAAGNTFVAVPMASISYQAF